MPGPETAARGRALLAERIAAAPDVLAALPERFETLLVRPARLPRMLVTTGIGTSEGHARHLAELAARTLGQPARFASTGSLANGPPRGAEADWLVVFSQGLSANARHALAHVEGWAGVVLVTGIAPTRDDAGVSVEKRAWLLDLERRGVVRLELGGGPEYGALLRVIGARAGYAAGWSILRTLAARRLESLPSLELAPDALRRAQAAAAQTARRVFPAAERVADFFAPERTLLLMGEGGTLELCDQLALKVAEGMLRPQPRAVDVLHFAHGPLQSLARRPLSILYLLPPGQAGSPWPARLAATLDPALHDLRIVRPTLPLPFACVELEAVFDEFVLRHQGETGLDLVDWPGAERERALYEAGPERPAARAARGRSPDAAAPPGALLERAVWPEVAAALAAGRRTAILPLGSVEQHGPHLPLGSDRWIADALAAALAERVGDAVALPALAFGCASEHLDFPGTLHVEPATLEAVIQDLLAAVARHAFEHAFVFTADGGNVDALGAMRARLAARARPLAVAVADAIAAGRLQAAAAAAAGRPAGRAGPHAGEYETSLVAWLAPGSVRLRALEAGPTLGPDDDAQALFYPSLRPHAPQGVLGDPTHADRARGAAYLDAWVDALATAYRAAFAPTAAGTGAGAEKKRK